MSDLRQGAFLTRDAERPYTDEEWARAAVLRAVTLSKLAATHYPELRGQEKFGEFTAINRGAKAMIRLAEAELQLWRDLEDETSFAEAR